MSTSQNWPKGQSVAKENRSKIGKSAKKRDYIYIYIYTHTPAPEAAKRATFPYINSQIISVAETGDPLCSIV